MWKHYLSSKVQLGKNKKKLRNAAKEILPAKYLEPPGNHMEKAVQKIDIVRSVVTYDVVIPFGSYEDRVCYIVAPARPYMMDHTIRPLPKERPLLHFEIEKTASRVRQAINTKNVPTKEKAPLFKEAAEGVRAAAEQDTLYGIFQREEGAKRWLYDMCELVQEKDVLLLCALHRATTRPYVHSMNFQRSRWKNFSTVMMEVSNAVGRCMACSYYYNVGRPLRALREEKAKCHNSHMTCRK